MIVKLQRNLNKIGINQSKKIGNLFKKTKLKLIRFYQVNGVDVKILQCMPLKNYEEFPPINSTFSLLSTKMKNVKFKILKVLSKTGMVTMETWF